MKPKLKPYKDWTKEEKGIYKASKTKSKTKKTVKYTIEELIKIFKKSPYSSGHTLKFLKWVKNPKKPKKKKVLNDFQDTPTIHGLHCFSCNKPKKGKVCECGSKEFICLDCMI